MIFHNIKDLHDNILYSMLTIPGTIGVTSGCFDIIHPMHVKYLARCKAKCDLLVVLIDSNDFIQVNKNKVPVFCEFDRAFMVDALKVTYAVCVMNSLEDFTWLLKKLKPITQKLVCFKRSSTVYDTPLIKVKGVDNIIVPDINSFDSTTSILEFIHSNPK